MGDACVGPLVGLVERAFGRGLVWPGAWQAKGAGQHLRHDGLAGRHVVPGHQLALCVQPGLEPRHAGGAVEVVLHVLFAGPQRLHRRAARSLGNGGGLGHVVHLQPPAKAAAQQQLVHGHLVFVDAQGLGGRHARQARHLGGCPHAGRAVLELHGAVDGLHGGVGQVGRAVVGREGGRCALQGFVHIAHAVVAKALGLVQRLGQLGHDGGARQRGGGAVVPLHGDCGGGLFGVPGRVGNHSHAAGAAVVRRDGQHLLHPRHLLRGCAIELGHLAAPRGAHHHAGVQQAGRVGVDAKHRTAVELGGRLDAGKGLADQLEFSGLLERDLARWRLLRRQCCQLAKRGALACRVFHHAGAGLAFGSLHLPLHGGCIDEHGAGVGTGLAHGAPQVLDAAGAARHHHAHFAHGLGRQPACHGLDGAVVVGVERQAVHHRGQVVVDVVDGRHLQPHLGPVGIQLLGQDGGQPGVRALAHFGLGHHHRHRVVGRYLEPAIQRHLARGLGQWLRSVQPLARGHHAPADDQRARRCGAAEEQCASFHHGLSLEPVQDLFGVAQVPCRDGMQGAVCSQ